jgi:hypothetical protein
MSFLSHFGTFWFYKKKKKKKKSIEYTGTEPVVHIQNFISTAKSYTLKINLYQET